MKLFVQFRSCSGSETHSAEALHSQLGLSLGQCFLFQDPRVLHVVVFYHVVVLFLIFGLSENFQCALQGNNTPASILISRVIDTNHCRLTSGTLISGITFTV